MGLIYWMGRSNGTGVYRMKMSGRQVWNSGVEKGLDKYIISVHVGMCVGDCIHMCDTLSEKDKC